MFTCFAVSDEYKLKFVQGQDLFNIKSEQTSSDYV